MTSEQITTIICAVLLLLSHWINYRASRQIHHEVTYLADNLVNPTKVTEETRP